MYLEDVAYQIRRIRKIEEEIAKRYSEQNMRCPVHLSVGQEWAAVALCKPLDKDDLLVSTHRSHAHYLAKGGDLNRFIAELYGKEIGCSGGHGGSMHLTDWECGFVASTSIVGGTIPIGVGLAFAKKMRGESGIAVSCFGDAATEEGVFFESLNFATLHNLPVIFFVENNGFSCDTPSRDRRLKLDLEGFAKSHGAAYAHLDSVDDIILKVSEFKEYAYGPMIMEVPVYRECEHCGPGITAKPLPPSPYDQMINREIENAFNLAEASPYPTNHGEVTYADVR